MDGGRAIWVIVAGAFFLLVFGGLTIAALSTAELNFATVVMALVCIFVCVGVIGAMIGAARKPPDE